MCFIVCRIVVELGWYKHCTQAADVEGATPLAAAEEHGKLQATLAQVAKGEVDVDELLG